MDEEGYIKVSRFVVTSCASSHSPNVVELDHGKAKGPHNPGRREHCTAS